MEKIVCTGHKGGNSKPVMIPFGKNSLGLQYICAVCSSVRQFNSGRIVSLNRAKGYGFIEGTKGNVFFHISNLAGRFALQEGMRLFYEIQFLDDGRIQAANITPAEGGRYGY